MRYCFNLRVRPERMTEYVERHQAVWPEMQDALRATGWRNYSLFLRPARPADRYVEADDLAASQAAMRRWTSTPGGIGMAEFFVRHLARRGVPAADEVFHLSDPFENPYRPRRRQTRASRLRSASRPGGAFRNSGTRFKVFARPVSPATAGEIADAAVVHLFTGCRAYCRAAHPWDKV